jgi:ketosteroid isomerase-like protein
MTTDASGTEASATAATERTRRVVTDFLAARTAGDAARMTELVTDDVEWLPPPSMGIGPFAGRDAVVKALSGGAVGRIFQPETVQRRIDHVVADGNTAVVQQTLTATTRKGARYENAYCWVYTCSGDKVARMVEYTDSFHAAKLFGMVPSS